MTPVQRKWLESVILVNSNNRSGLNVNDYIEEHNDGSVSISGDVIIPMGYPSPDKISHIPIKFRHVTGDFNCSDNLLTSMDNAPDTINGWLGCTGNPFIPTRELFAYFDKIDHMNKDILYARLYEDLHKHYGLNPDNPLIPAIWNELTGGTKWKQKGGF